MLEEILAASGTLWTIVVKLSGLKENQFWIALVQLLKRFGITSPAEMTDME